MIMKWLNFNSIIGMAVLSLLFYTENVAAQTDKNDTKQKIDTIQTTQPEYSKYDKRIHRFRKGWNSLIPTHNKIQYAGNMGMFSFGTGWDYGKRDQWETDLFFGFIPKHDSHRAKMTMTLKQNYMPWAWSLGKDFQPNLWHVVSILTLFSDTNSGYTSLAVIRKDTTDSRPRYAHTSFWDNG